MSLQNCIDWNINMRDRSRQHAAKLPACPLRTSLERDARRYQRNIDSLNERIRNER